MPITVSRIVVLLLSLILCAGTAGISPPLAHADDTSSENDNDIPVIGVGKADFFDEGRYINLADYQNDISIEDFETQGGTMIELADGGPRYAEGRDTSPYGAMQIFSESIAGYPESIPGYGFLCSKPDAQANGASVSIRYAYVGDMLDAADPSFSIPVSIRATYTIRDGLTIDEEGDFKSSYTGYPLVQIPTCFSHGIFFVGTNVLDANYEFFNADTGEPIELGSIYVTATSLNRGEGFAVPTEYVRACYVSNNAPDSSTFYNKIGAKTPYEVITGSFLYNKTAEFNDGYTTFIGAPDIYDANGTKTDFTDSIGAETFYWRSVCFALDLGTSNTLETKGYAIKTADWSGTEGVESDGIAKNGSMWYATNFMMLTSVAPEAPVKTSSTSEALGIGDTLTYYISQQVANLGSTSFVRYSSLCITDALPSTLRYIDARLVDENGTEIEGAGLAQFDEESRTVSFVFADSYLSETMSMTGETYTLEIETEVLSYPDDGTLSFVNTATSTINGLELETNEVVHELLSPVLNVKKRTGSSAAGAADESDANGADNADNATTLPLAWLAPEEGYEFAVGDEIYFYTSLTQTVSGALAQAVVFSDTLPAGLSLVSGSVSVSGSYSGEAIVVEEANGWTVTIDTLAAHETLRVSYRAIAEAEANGAELVNLASAWAQNVAEGEEGSETNPAEDEAEVFINSPELSISEVVSVSPSTGNSFEHRLGEELVITITLENIVEGTIATNVSLLNLSLPEGLAIVDASDATWATGSLLEGEATSIIDNASDDNDVNSEDNTDTNTDTSASDSSSSDESVNASDNNNAIADSSNDSAFVSYPVADDARTHGQTEQRAVEYSITPAADRLSATLLINYLSANEPIQLHLRCLPLDEANGTETLSRATADASNAAAVDSSPATHIWVNSPNLVVQKAADDLVYQEGSEVEYRVSVSNTTRGTVATNIVLEDVFDTPGMSITESSIAVTNLEGEPLDATRTNYDAATSTLHIETFASLVHTEDHLIWNCDSEEFFSSGKPNPIGVERELGILVSYCAVVGEEAAEQGYAVNIVTATSDEGSHAPSTETIAFTEPLVEPSIPDPEEPEVEEPTNTTKEETSIANTASNIVSSVLAKTGDKAVPLAIGACVLAVASVAAMIAARRKRTQVPNSPFSMPNLDEPRKKRSLFGRKNKDYLLWK